MGNKPPPAEFSFDTMFMSADQVSTKAVVGYGNPTTGDYSPTTKGYKSFGTVGQGTNNKGVYDTNGKSC